MILRRIARTRKRGIAGIRTLPNKYSNYIRHLDISEWENVAHREYLHG
jgi:hypothetical protein